MSVESFPDEMWVGVRIQSNAEISWFSRNSRAVQGSKYDGRALIRLGAIKGYRTLSNSNGYTVEPWVRLRVIRSVVKREAAQTTS